MSKFLLGAETFLHMLLTRMQTDLAMSTSSLICLPLEQSIRRKAGEALIPSKMKVCTPLPRLTLLIIVDYSHTHTGYSVCTPHHTRPGDNSCPSEETLRPSIRPTYTSKHCPCTCYFRITCQLATHMSTEVQFIRFLTRLCELSEARRRVQLRRRNKVS